MPGSVKHLALRALDSSGAARMVGGRLLRRSLTIVMYHGVVRERLPIEDYCFVQAVAFERHLDYLQRHFDILPLSRGVERLRSGQILRPAAVITFDDGYANNFDVAYPILLRRHLPATVFLNTGFIDTDETVWFCRLLDALGRSRSETMRWRGETYLLRTGAERARSAATLQSQLKELEHEILLKELALILSALGDDVQRPLEPNSPYRMLSRSQIEEMLQTGLVEFGAHTRTHPILARTSPESARREIEDSLCDVERLTRQPCALFAYPNGRPADYTVEALECLRARGVRAAVTTIEGANFHDTAPLELLRVGIGCHDSDAQVHLNLHHIRRWRQEAGRWL